MAGANKWLVRFAVALTAQAAVAVWVGLIAASLGGGLAPFWSGLSLVTGGAVGVAAAWHSCAREMSAWRWPEWLMLLAALLAGARAFFWLTFSNKGELLVLSPVNLGDLSLHLHLMQYFAAGVPFWPESPILTGTPLIYPLGADFYNALLIDVGVPVFRSLTWCGIAATVAAVAALLRWGGWFGLAAFFFSGAFAYLMAINSGRVPSATDAFPWQNLFLTVFVTQRGMLFALPAGLLLLASWRDRAERKAPLLPIWVEVVLYASLPLFSIHAFLAVSIFAAAIFLATRNRRILLTVAAAFVPATLAVLLVTDFFGAASGVSRQIGWMMGEQGWTFWLKNFGLILPLGVGLALFVGSRNFCEERDLEPATARAFVWAACLLFATCCFVSFATWPWDNIKLMLWSWLALAPFLDQLLLQRIMQPFRVVVYVLIFLPGAVALGTGLDGRHGYGLADRIELARIAAATQGIAPTATFAAAPEYNHPLILNGRKMVAGYDGHLYSHGLDYRATLRDLTSIMRGEPDWEEAAQRLQPDFLFWGRREDARYNRFPDNLPLGSPIASGEWGAIYAFPDFAQTQNETNQDE